jgi:hypothetical protein
MAVTSVHVQIVLPNIDGLAKNEFETSLNFNTTDLDTTGMSPLITAFFNTAGTGQTHPIASYIGTQVTRTANQCEIRYYDKTAHLDGTPSGPPYQVDSFTMGAKTPGGPNLPNQCCATLSYYDALDAEGTTRGSNRGRMFIGPLGPSAVDSFTDDNQVLTTQFGTDLVYGFKNLVDGALALSTPKTIAVWTRKHAGMVPVIGCWVTDQIDTQRRRAYPKSTRQVLPLP